MATLVLEPTRRRITVDQFFAEVGETEERYELIDGEIWHMAGGSQRHATVTGQIFGILFIKLASSGCRPLGSDMAVQLDDYNFRYPDVAIYCDPRDLGPQAADEHRLHYPKVIFEVLSPSTAKSDRAVKVAEYKALSSVSAIVLVDPVARTVELHERTDPGAWLQRELPAGKPLELRDPAITLTAAEIFGEA